MILHHLLTYLKFLLTYIHCGYIDLLLQCYIVKKNILQNLEIKKINDEKKASMAAQFAAEATLRRVHAAQKDDDMPPIEAILAPLEAELKLARQEVLSLSLNIYMVTLLPSRTRIFTASLNCP